MRDLISCLRTTLKTNTTKAGDASDKSYQVTTSNSPVYLYCNRICYEERLYGQ